jgi:hypothetical protein
MKDKSMRLSVRVAVAILLLFSGRFGAFAQEAIAVHPLSDETGSPMTVIFLEELIKAIPRVPGYNGAYRPYAIDLTNRPADVPDGGFPPYICPSPSLTAGAAYAMTGEVGADRDNPGSYWARIYLWKMDNGRLIVSDMVNAADRESCAASYPYVLAYLFSIVDENKILSQSAQPQLDQAQTVYRPSSRPRSVQNWLNLGLHAGGGNSTWFIEDITSSALNFNAAFQTGVNITSWFAIHAEANFNMHFDLENFDNRLQHLTVPLLFRFNWLNDAVKAGVYLGPYMYFPAPWSDNLFEGTDFYKLLGICYGISVGWKLGPGYIFLDGRMGHLLLLDDGIKYPSNTAVFGIGYEVELIKKRVRQ